MNIQYKTKDVELTDPLRDYTQGKLQILNKFLKSVPEDSISFDVELSEEIPNKGGEYRADITLHASDMRIHAVGRGETLNAAVDNAKDELERRLRREKRKRLTLFKKGARKIKDILHFRN